MGDFEMIRVWISDEWVSECIDECVGGHSFIHFCKSLDLQDELVSDFHCKNNL
jgi:hypothetical protein